MCFAHLLHTPMENAPESLYVHNTLFLPFSHGETPSGINAQIFPHPFLRLIRDTVFSTAYGMVSLEVILMIRIVV